MNPDRNARFKGPSLATRLETLAWAPTPSYSGPQPALGPPSQGTGKKETPLHLPEVCDFRLNI